MIAMHATPALDNASMTSIMEHVTDSGVFGEGEPTIAWPRLEGLRDGNIVDEAGVASMVKLQRLPSEHIPDFRDQTCLFIQAQRLSPGVEVTPHKDPVPSGGHVIATAVLDGSSHVRVGNVVFRVGQGDVYALTGPARYQVDHEVYSSTQERTSITLRYGLDCTGAPSALVR